MAALPDPGAEPDPDPQPAKTLTPEQEEQAIIVQYELLWKLTDQLAQSMLSDDCAYIHPAWASRNVYAWRAEYFGPEVAAADWADARQRGDWHKRIWDENGHRPAHPARPNPGSYAKRVRPLRTAEEAAVAGRSGG